MPVPFKGGGGSGGVPRGKFSKNEAKSCILSEKKGGGVVPGTQEPIRGTRLSNDQLLEMRGERRSRTVLIRQQRLEWLYHVARMPSEHIPKVLSTPSTSPMQSLHSAAPVTATFSTPLP